MEVINPPKQKKLLTVCIITYSHAKYLKEAVDSVLAQKTSFEFDIVIADDCSQDGTREIAMDYALKYPMQITLLLQTKNVGPAQNFIDLIQFPKSTYLAYLEGDDYWIDENKLEKQVALLERSKESNIIAGLARNYDQSKKKFIKAKETNKWSSSTISPIDYLFKRPFNISSIVFKNNFSLPPWFKDTHPGDKFFVILSSNKKPITIISEEIIVYRKHKESSTGTLTKKKQNEKIKSTINALTIIKPQFDPHSQQKINQLIAYYQRTIEISQKSLFQGLISFIGFIPFLITNREWSNWKVPASRLRKN